MALALIQQARAAIKYFVSIPALVHGAVLLGILVHQRRDLLRDQTHHEGHHAACVEQGTHVGKAV